MALTAGESMAREIWRSSTPACTAAPDMSASVDRSASRNTALRSFGDIQMPGSIGPGRLILVALASGLFAPTALAIDVSLRVPVGCTGGSNGCEEDISLADATKSADSTTKILSECLKDKKLRKARRACRLCSEGRFARPSPGQRATRAIWTLQLGSGQGLTCFPMATKPLAS